MGSTDNRNTTYNILVFLKGQEELSEFEYVAVFSEVREIPRDKMAQMNATIIFWSKIMSK
jgi:hypothetical protein